MTDTNNTIAQLSREAASLREASLDLVTVDHIRARKLLREAEALETRIVLLKAAGLSGTHRPFRRHFLAGVKR